MNPELKIRLKSTLWHIGAMAGVMLITFALDPAVIEALKLPQFAVVGLGLVMAQLTKYLNS